MVTPLSSPAARHGVIQAQSMFAGRSKRASGDEDQFDASSHQPLRQVVTRRQVVGGGLALLAGWLGLGAPGAGAALESLGQLELARDQKANASGGGPNNVPPIAVIDEANITVEPVVENGLPQNRSRIRVPFRDGVVAGIADASKITVTNRLQAVPAPGVELAVPVKILSLEKVENGKALVLVTDRQLTKGSRLDIQPGALKVSCITDPPQQPSSPWQIFVPVVQAESVQGTCEFPGASVVLKAGIELPESFMAYRDKLRPQDINLFTPFLYPGAIDATPTVGEPDCDTVQKALNTFLLGKAARNIINQQQYEQALERFNELADKIKRNDPSRIVKSYNLAAALIALTGTSAEPVIGEVLDSGRYSSVAYGPLYGLSQEYNAITQEIAGKIQITFNSNNANNNRRNMTGENFIRLSALMAHEVGVHQDNPNSTREEEIAQLVEAVVLKEQQAAGAEIIATGNSRYQRGHNDLLLALNMSGANTFPGRVGLKQSAGVDNIAPDSPPNTVVQGGKFQSFDHLMTTLYANLGATVRPAHPITQTILRRITGDPDLVVTQFDDALIDELDRIGVYPAEDAVQVASWFKLSNSSAAPA